jgi:PPOX class probable F420-dependent enzyme
LVNRSDSDGGAALDARKGNMKLADAMKWASTRKTGTLVTLRRDGRPQSSDVVYAVDADAFLISVTTDRAKTANMRRDPRVVLHLSEPASWSYLSFDGAVELSAVTLSTHDATNEALVTQYEMVTGKPHPNWSEFRQAMVDERRLVVRLAPSGVVGQAN